MAGDEKDQTSGKRLTLKWLEEPNHDRAKRSRKQETRVAKELGGRRLPRSGGMRWSKWKAFTDDGDLSTEALHVEHKRTDKKSLSLKKEWLSKVSEGAHRVAKVPAVVITFEEPHKPGTPPEDWIMIPLSALKRLLENDDE